ncbi:uncharacterized protein [Elaeis guineensis]|uniref:Transcription factor GAMYB n=1 Tax=Elaeis guineensis var. tenera TaxID=51953 RepID=A0A6I9SE03_ELAGV|nr:transcription factor MYB101 isoform X1 [Elaeis guineensis]
MTRSDGGGSGNGGLKKGPWTAAEDAILMEYVRKQGEGNWNAVQKNTGLARCGKSCRLRWANHLRPNLKKGAFSPDEELLILRLHAQLGNKWARMAAHLPGRTDNEIKNYWNTRIKRRQRAGLPLYPPDVQRELAFKRQRLHHNHPPSTNPPAPLLTNNTTITHFSSTSSSLLDPTGYFSTPMLTTFNAPLPLPGHHLHFPSSGMFHTQQQQQQQMEFNLGSFGLNSLPLPPPVFPNKMELPSTQMFTALPFSGGLLDTLLQEVQPGGHLQSNGLLPELVSGDQDVKLSHLCGGGVGGEGGGSRGVTLPQDGLMESAVKWTDSNWSIGTQMKKEPTENDTSPVEEDISQLLNMIPTVNAAAATPVSEWYKSDSGEISNGHSSVVTEEHIGLEMQQLVSSLSNPPEGPDLSIRSYPWSNMPGIC